VRTDRKSPHKADKKTGSRAHKQGVVGYSKKSALLEEAITHMNTGKYGRSSAALKELLSLDPQNTEARRLFATLHLRLGSLVTAREAFESLANEAIGRQDYWLAESLLREYLAAGPRCIPFLELLANVYHDKGDDMAAVAELGKAIEILLEDPDPDNPKKPAQLYSRIRELAPGSPPAFQFASSFDIQTGEFRVIPPPVSSLAPAADLSLKPPDSTPTPHIQTDSKIEVMPWEQVDEPSVSPPTPSLIPPAVEVPEQGMSGSLMNPIESTAASLEVESPVFESAITSSIETPVEPAIPSVHGEPTSVTPVLHEMAAMDLRVESGASFEGNGAQAIASGPDAEIRDGGPFESSGASESIPMPSRMPWEHVADPALQIAEIEPAPSAPMPEVSTDSPSEQDLALAPSASNDLDIVAAVKPPEAASAQPEDHAATASETVQEFKQADAREPMPSAPNSFSWNAIFDTAWKIAAGTTASSPSIAATEPDTSTASDTKEGLERQRLEGKSPNLEGSEEFTHQPSMKPAGESTGETVFPAVEEFVSPAVYVASQDPVHEGASDVPRTSTAIIDPTLVTGEPFTVPSKSESNPAAESVPHISSELSRAIPASEPERSNSVVPPATLSFSAVVDKGAIELPPKDESQPSPHEAAPEPSAATSDFNAASSSLNAPPVEKPQSEPVQLSTPQPAMSPPMVIKVPEPPPTQGVTVPWNTGEVAVQSHRPTAKMKRWEKDPSAIAEQATTPSVDFRISSDTVPDELPEEDSLPGEAAESTVEEVAVKPVDVRPEWAQASDTIILAKPELASSTTWDVSVSGSFQKTQGPTTSAASAVDVLFGMTTRETQSVHKENAVTPRPRRWMAARLARIRQNVSLFVGSCFSTTRAFVLLCVSLAILSVVSIAVGLGFIALTWIVIEESPTARYQSLTIAPQRVLTDNSKNGYFLLLGFDAPAGQDPNQAGYERKVDEQDRAMALSCMQGGPSAGGSINGGAQTNVVGGWFKSSEPLAQFRGQTETLKPLLVRHSTFLARYQKWLTMPFDDWGYGKNISPNCAQILLAHRLFILEGFSQDSLTGLNRLEKDMEAWRAALGQSKTLMTKMLAVSAVQDDALLASGLLILPDTDGAAVARLSKLVRPFDQLELSVRWPMQSHFVWSTETATAKLKKDQGGERPLHVAIAAAMPLPVQRRSNAYAEYYDAANKAVAEGRYSSLPKVSTFIRTSAASLVDYWANPIELLVGVDPLPTWDPYVGRMVEADAQLRLASLQAWVRRGPHDGDVLARLAKAGQAYYDPFTGLPMLVNQRKRLLYSVGRDGKDQDGDPSLDVVAAIPNLASSLGKQAGGK
jgi:hypothetical protein